MLEAKRSIVVVGTQWGDEGKGKVIDGLASEVDAVIRYQGGANAGHTVYVNGEKYVFHQLPSGILYPGKKNVLGDCMVIDPKLLYEEISELKQRGALNGELYVSNRAHVVLPHYKPIEGELEKKLHIGTTGKAIGVAYFFKAMRAGIRICDLYDERELKERVRLNLDVSRLFLPPDYTLDANELIKYLMDSLQGYGEYVKDTSFLIDEWISNGYRLLFESAQGTHLDIDHGTYPHITSSNPTAGGSATGAGIGPHKVDWVLGVVKAYPTRVGNGAFPTELGNAASLEGIDKEHPEDFTEADRDAMLNGDKTAIGKYIRKTAEEYGATTGRPRRTGWPDAVVLRYSKRVNGIHAGALTRLDVLDGIDPIRVCTGYELDGRLVDEISEPFPASEAELRRCKPVYESLPGWPASSFGATEYNALHGNARRLIERKEELTGIPFGIISTGPRRHETIFR